jgi:hypothetical protein
MHVLRVVRVLLVVLVVAAVVGAGSSVLSARPDLQTAKRNVDASWATLAPLLDQRYLRLAAVNDQLKTVEGPVHTLVGDTDTALAHWRDVRQHAGVATQVEAANQVEGVARRLLATQAASPRVQGNADILTSVGKFLGDNTHNAAADFNDAVAGYEHERRGPVRAVVAAALGDSSIPMLDTTATPTPTGGPASS